MRDRTRLLWQVGKEKYVVMCRAQGCTRSWSPVERQHARMGQVTCIVLTAATSANLKTDAFRVFTAWIFTHTYNKYIYNRYTHVYTGALHILTSWHNPRWVEMKSHHAASRSLPLAHLALDRATSPILQSGWLSKGMGQRTALRHSGPRNPK